MSKEQENGIPNAEVCRKYGVSSASFYKYKSKYGGMDVLDAETEINLSKHDYNQNRPYSSLSNLTPNEFASKTNLHNMAA